LALKLTRPTKWGSIIQA